MVRPSDGWSVSHAVSNGHLTCITVPAHLHATNVVVYAVLFFSKWILTFQYFLPPLYAAIVDFLLDAGVPMPDVHRRVPMHKQSQNLSLSLSLETDGKIVEILKIYGGICCLFQSFRVLHAGPWLSLIFLIFHGRNRNSS